MSMEARIADLEAQLHEAQAQTDATAINAEHAGQAMERRYTALAEDQGRLAAEKEKLVAENSKLSQDLQAAKSENSRLQATVFEKDAIIQRKDVEIEALHSDKRTLAKVLQQREAELEESHNRHRQCLDKIVTLSNTSAALDAEAHEARAAKNRLQQEKLKVEQQMEVLESHNKWLEEELASKIEAAQQERRTISAHVVQLQQAITNAEDKVQQFERSERRLKERVAELQRSAEGSQQSLKAAKDESNSKEQIFHKELATAQKLSRLYKEASEERSRKCTELEGIIRELQKHLEEAEVAQRDVLERAEARASAAEQEASAEREKCRRVMEAAAKGNLPLVTTPGSDGPVSPNGETLSHTELYMKYVEATTQCRHESLAKRQIEIMLEQVMGEIEAKSELVREQDREFNRVQAAHEQIAASLAIITSENRQHIARINQLEAEARRGANERRVLEQQVKDLGQQVAVLLNQVQTLQGSRASRPPAASPSTPSSSSSLITSNDIISGRLLYFQDIQGLQQKNLELLTVVRQLGAEKDQERALVEQEKARDREALEAEKNALYAERAKQQELFEQIVRQRDMFKKLFQDASGAAGTPQADGARLLLPPPGTSVPHSNGHSQDKPDYEAMHRDVEKELENVRKEGEEHVRMLNQECSKAKEAASAARSEAARMRNEAEFERERGQRLQEQLRDLHQQLEALTQSNTKYQVLVNELQQRLSNLDSELGTLRDKTRQAEARANSLQNEKALLTSTEQRLLRTVEELSMEKHKLSAQLQVEQKESADKEAEYVAQRGRLTGEVAQLQRDLALAQKDSSEEQRHLKAAALESQAAADRAESKAKLAEEATQHLRTEAAQAAQRAISAEVKVEVLQKAVQQAEERVATLEMQIQSRSGMLEDSSDGNGAGSQAPAGSREADLNNQIKLLREELTSAQETAAAATGHSKQYEMLAKSSDEAVKAMQGQLEKVKAEYEEQMAAIRKEAEDLQGQVTDLEKARSDAYQRVQAAEKALEEANRQSADREAQLQAQLADRDKDRQQVETRLKRQYEDIEQLRTQYRSVQSSYDRQVVEHAAAVNKLNAVEVALKAASEKAQQQEDALSHAQRQKEDAETELKRQQLVLEQKVQAAEVKFREVEEQNGLLHSQLVRVAEQQASTEHAAADGGGGELAQVVAYLRKEQAILSTELDAARQEAARLRNDSIIARRMADAANAQMASQAERAQQSARTEEDHAVLMQKVEQLNWLRDSNDKLRADNDRIKQEVSRLRQRAEQAETAAEPLHRRIRELSAQVESHAEEMRVANESAQQWEKRAQQLQQKYGKVDLAEHQRVQQKLATAEAELTQLCSSADTSNKAMQTELEKVKAQLDQARKQEMIAKKMISRDYNPEKLHIHAWKEAQANMKQRLAQMEQSAADAAKVTEEVNKLQEGNAELKKQVAELEKELSKTAKEAEDAKNDLKAREGRQQQEKQLSINAVQSERRRQAEEKASLQNALDATISRAAAAENKIRALEQTIAQLQSEVTSEKAKSAALESDLSACRAGMAKPLEQVTEPVEATDQELEAADAPVAEPEVQPMEATVAPPSPEKPADDAEQQPNVEAPDAAPMPSSPPAAVQAATPSPQIPPASEPTGSGAASLQDQLRAQLLARGRSPVPEPAKPSTSSMLEERKREADVIEQPAQKRARTASELDASVEAESFQASLEETSDAAERKAEQADAEVEMCEEEKQSTEQHEEEYEGEYEDEEDGAGDEEAEERIDEGEHGEHVDMEEHDGAAQDAEDMLEDHADDDGEGHYAHTAGKDTEEEMADVGADAQEPAQTDMLEAKEAATISEARETAEPAEEKKLDEGIAPGNGKEAEQPAAEHVAENKQTTDAALAEGAAQREQHESSKEAERQTKTAAEEQAGPSDGSAARPFRKKSRIEWKAEAVSAAARPAAPSLLSPVASPFTPVPGGRGAAPGRVQTPGRGGAGRLYAPSSGRAAGQTSAGRSGRSPLGAPQQRGGRGRGRTATARGRRQPTTPDGQPPADGQE